MFNLNVWIDIEQISFYCSIPSDITQIIDILLLKLEELYVIGMAFQWIFIQS